MRITLDISPLFARTIERLCDNRSLEEIKELIINQMSAIEDLRTAVTDNTTATAEGFETVNAAMEELATDIQNLPDAADVTAEVARLAGNTEAIRAATASLAQAVRDAIPTEVVEAPEV